MDDDCHWKRTAALRQEQLAELIRVTAIRQRSIRRRSGDCIHLERLQQVGKRRRCRKQSDQTG
jgi:hypothetical protein